MQDYSEKVVPDQIVFSAIIDFSSKERKVLSILDARFLSDANYSFSGDEKFATLKIIQRFKRNPLQKDLKQIMRFLKKFARENKPTTLDFVIRRQDMKFFYRLVRDKYQYRRLKLFESIPWYKKGNKPDAK